MVEHVVGDHHELRLLLLRLVEDNAREAERALAGDVIVQNDHVAVELLRLVPKLDEVLPAAGQVAAHDAGLIIAGNAVEHGVLVRRVNEYIAGEQIHAGDHEDAPAVIQPVRELQPVARRAAPGDGAVARLGEAVGLALVRLLEDLHDLALCLHDLGIAAAGECVVVSVEQVRHGERGGGVGRGHEVPLLHLVAHLVVVLFHDVTAGIPVIGLAGVLLDKVDDAAQGCAGVLARVRIGPAHGNGSRQRVHVEVALDDLAVHGRGVARGIVRDAAGADLRELVEDGDAGGVVRQAAGVCRQADALHGVDIVRVRALIHVAQQQALERLELRGAQIREAREDLGAHGLLKHDLRAAEGIVTEAAVAHHHLGDGGRRALHDRVEVNARHAQRRAAQALDAAVDHVQRREVRAHPAVGQHAAHDAHRALGHKAAHDAEHFDPFDIVVPGIFQTAPLAVLCNVAAGQKTIPGAFDLLVRHHSFPP